MSLPNQNNFGDYVKRWSHTLKRNVNKKVIAALSVSPTFTNTTSPSNSHQYHSTFINKPGIRSIKGSHTLPKASGLNPPILIVDLGPARLFEDDFYGYGLDQVPLTVSTENMSTTLKESPTCVQDQIPFTTVTHSPAYSPDQSPSVQSISSMIVNDPDVSLFGTLAVEDIEPYSPALSMHAQTEQVHKSTFSQLQFFQDRSPVLDEFENKIRILAEYCFNVAYVTDWMNCDIPPPLAFFETTGVGSQSSKLAKNAHRIPFNLIIPQQHFTSSSLPTSPIRPDFEDESPSSSRSPSFTNAAMTIPLRVGPLAQHVMDIYHWEPDNKYSPLDVRVFYLHLKTLMQSLTSMIDCYNANVLQTAPETNPPRFLCIDHFPSATHHLHRLQHIMQAVRTEMKFLVEQYPIVATQRAFDPYCVPSDPSCPNGNVFDPYCSTPPDWIRNLIPDDPLPLLRYFLNGIGLHMAESDHGLPMDSKNKILFDRVCQIWRISSVLKNVLLAEWVVNLLQIQPDAKLWPCLATRIDKVVINVRREKATLSNSDIESVHAFIQLATAHAQSYVSNLSDFGCTVLVEVIDVNKHLDTCAHLFDLPPSFQILDAFAKGYVHRLLHTIPIDPNSDPTDTMRLISDTAYQVAGFVSTLNLPNDLVRNQLMFLLSHTYIAHAKELCPVEMPNTEIWDVISAVCYQYSHVACVKAMMNSAREYLVDYAQTDLSCRRQSYTPDHMLYLKYLQQIQKHLVAEKPALDFFWDTWLLSLENDFCIQVQRELFKLVSSDSDSRDDDLSVQKGNRPNESQSCVVTLLKETFLKYFTHAQKFPFPNIHHSVRMVKSLTRILTHAITSHAKSCYLHTLNVPVVNIVDILDTLENQIRELLKVSQALSHVHTVIQTGLSKVLSDEDMNEYHTPFDEDEVMAKMYISNKPLGYRLEVRADGHLVMTINPASSTGTMYLPIRLQRVLELQLVKVEQVSTLPTEQQTAKEGTGTDTITDSNGMLLVTLPNVDFWETTLTFDNVSVPVSLEVQRDDASYVSVYFSQCADGVTQTIDSLLSIVAQKTVQILLDIVRQCKKLLKSANIDEPYAKIPLPRGKSNVQKIPVRTETNKFLPPKAPNSLDVISNHIDESVVQSHLTKNLEHNFKEISGIMVRLGNVNGNNSVLADRLRDEVWKYLTTHLTLDVFKMKSDTEIKERPASYIEWLNFILIQCCSALYPENSDESGSESEENDLDRILQQSYLPVVLSRYTQNTSVLKEEYSSKITRYLSHISRHIPRDSGVYSHEHDYESAIKSKRPIFALFTPSSGSSPTERSTLVLNSMTLPRSRAYDNICATFGDPVFPGTSNRASLFFNYDKLAELANLTITNTPTHLIPSHHLLRQTALSPAKVVPSPKAHKSYADPLAPLTQEQISENMFQFLCHYLPTAQPISSLINPPLLSFESYYFSQKIVHGTGTDSVPLSYSLFAILAIIRIRAETDTDLNEWILQQYEADQLALKAIITRMQPRPNLKSSVQKSPVLQ